MPRHNKDGHLSHTASAAERTTTNSWDGRGRRLQKTGPNGTVGDQDDVANRCTRLTCHDGLYLSCA